MLIKISHILEHHASHTQQFAWQFYFWSKQCVYLHRPRTLIELSLSTIHQPLLSPSCNWFFVFQALRCPRNPNFSFFTPSLRRASVIRWSERFFDGAIPAESRHCVSFDFQVCDGGMYGKWGQIVVSVQTGRSYVYWDNFYLLPVFWSVLFSTCLKWAVL